MRKKLSRDEELTAEQARHRSRAFSVFVDGDGMYVVKGRLEPEVGAVLMRAVEAASDALFRGEDGANDARPGAKARDPRIEKTDPRPEPKQRRADAVGLLAERALAMGFGGDEPRDSRGDSDPLATESRGESGGEPAGDPVESGLQNRPRAESGTRAERYQVMVHCDAATLAGRVKVSVATDGTVVFFTRGGKMLADAPRQVWRDLAPVPPVHPAALGKGDGLTLSNGAALYRDSEIPWEIEAAAREAVEESFHQS